MATVTFYKQGDMNAFLGYDQEEVLSTSPTEIRVGIDGYYYDSYKGTGFTYSATAVTGGTVTQFDSYHGWGVDLAVRVTGANASAVTVADHVLSGNSDALKAYVLRGADAINGSVYGDRLLGMAGNDTLNGGGGSDTMAGGTGSDLYYVQQAGDVVSEAAGGGADTVYSYLSAYTLTGNVENGTVRLTGSAGLTGNTLANKLVGGSGNNALSGGSGNDTLSGGAGSDRLIGGAGNDVLTGGSGTDTFRFTHAPSATGNIDRIADFSAADDVIQLENAVFAKLAATGGLAATNFRAGAGAKALDANDFVLYDTATGSLSYDADGSGAGAAVRIAVLTGAPSLGNVDIFVT
jgi:Ca2+-binding RTX toxin-like protein